MKRTHLLKPGSNFPAQENLSAHYARGIPAIASAEYLKANNCVVLAAKVTLE